MVNPIFRKTLKITLTYFLLFFALCLVAQESVFDPKTADFASWNKEIVAALTMLLGQIAKIFPAIGKGGTLTKITTVVAIGGAVAGFVTYNGWGSLMDNIWQIFSALGLFQAGKEISKKLPVVQISITTPKSPKILPLLIILMMSSVYMVAQSMYIVPDKIIKVQDPETLENITIERTILRTKKETIAYDYWPTRQSSYIPKGLQKTNTVYPKGMEVILLDCNMKSDYVPVKFNHPSIGKVDVIFLFSDDLEYVSGPIGKRIEIE